MPNIISSSLCHLKVIRCYFITNNIQVDLNLILVDCLKLTSLQYHGYDMDTLNINTPMLKCIYFIISLKDLNKCVALCASFPELQILHVDKSLTVSRSVGSVSVFFYISLTFELYFESYTLLYRSQLL